MIRATDQIEVVPSAWRGRLAVVFVLLCCVAPTWTAPDRGAWASAALLTLTGYLGFEGVLAPALQPWWYRRPVEALAAPAALSVLRVRHLPPGGAGWFVAGLATLVATVLVLATQRRHRWGGGPAIPLDRFPVHGRWYVVQGGGPRLNHHSGVLPQRGAIDIVKVGRHGTVTGRGTALEDHLAYGQDVVAPCDGVVTAAAGSLPDQTPGSIRPGPVYGNHIVIDTGSEQILLAHLRPGTLAVTSGQRVRPGQFLAQVGNSGNSTEPHLHLQCERAGTGLDLRFIGIRGGFYRGRTVTA